MAKPIAPASNIAFAFPDVCLTPTPGGNVPIPYPNIADLSAATNISDDGGKELLVGGEHVLLEISKVAKPTTGGEPGTGGGVISGDHLGECSMVSFSGSVFYGSQKAGLVRFMDTTDQNAGNVQGMILSANPTVLVGD